MRILAVMLVLVASLAHAQSPEVRLPAKREVPLDLLLAGDVARKPADRPKPALTARDLDPPPTSKRRQLEDILGLLQSI